MRILKAHWGILVLLSIAGPLTFLFAVQDCLATFGDDSASYLVLAHYFAGSSGSALVAQWAPFHSHFPPLLAMLLAASGGVTDYRVATALIALSATLCLPLIYLYASRRLGRAAALAVVALFVLTPTAWICVKGILSEPLYLLMTIAALLHFEARIASGNAGVAERMIFGLLLAGACLTRVIGVTLVAAYLVHSLLSMMMRREPLRARWVAPLATCAALVGLWYALRPVAIADTYGRTAFAMATAWAADPLAMLGHAGRLFAAGWVSTFTADANVPTTSAFAAAILGLLALAGVARRLAGNHIDAWYVVFSLGVILPWVFNVDNTRRLLYPLVPVLLVSAADFLRWTGERIGLASRGRAALFGAAIAMQLAIALPGVALIAGRAQDHTPVVPGLRYTYRDVTDYYTTIDAGEARKRAMVVVATLGGLESIAKVAPPAATVMWMRPEYVALLGQRRAVPFLYRWDGRTLAREVARSKTDYVVVTVLLKTDMTGQQGDPGVDTSAYARPAVVLLEGVFTLMQVDRAALERFLATP